MSRLRQQTAALLQLAAIRYRSLFENAVVGICQTTPAGQFLTANRTLVRLLGYDSVGELQASFSTVGLQLPVEPERLAEGNGRLATPGGVRRFETQLCRKDGSILWASVCTQAVYNTAGTLLYFDNFIEDITARERIKAERARRTAQLQALAQVSQEINATLSLKEAIQIIAERTLDIVGVHQAAVKLTSNDSRTRTIEHVATSDTSVAWYKFHKKLKDSGISARVCRQKRPMRLTQAALAAHPEWWGEDGQAVGRHVPLRGWLAAPLVGSDGRNLGLIQLADKREGEFTEEDEAILVQLAQLTAMAVEKARLAEQVQAGHERLQALSHRLVQVQETERREIVRELHDEVGQTLTGLKLLLETSMRLPGSEAARANLCKGQGLLDELMARVRTLSLHLRPTMLDDLGLLPALLWHFERYTAQTRVQVVFTHDGLEGRRFLPEVETAVYRIAQEALTNVFRHARVNEVCVTIRANTETLHLRIEDHGRGIPPAVMAVLGASTGLGNMQERVRLLGGQCLIDSAPGMGTRILVTLPLQYPSTGENTPPCTPRQRRP
jgi:PAS domain S-box-containing protein